MTNDQFNIILSRRLEQIREVLGRKAGEYASDADRLHNFERAAMILRVTPQNALLGMLIKHIVSVLDMVQANKTVSIAVADEKIGDTINYLILLEAVLDERRERGYKIAPTENAGA